MRDSLGLDFRPSLGLEIEAVPSERFGVIADLCEKENSENFDISTQDTSYRVPSLCPSTPSAPRNAPEPIPRKIMIKRAWTKFVRLFSSASFSSAY